METMILRPNGFGDWLRRPCPLRARLRAAGPDKAEPDRAAAPSGDDALAACLESSRGGEPSPLFAPESSAYPLAPVSRSERYLRPGLRYCF